MSRNTQKSFGERCWTITVFRNSPDLPPQHCTKDNVRLPRHADESRLPASYHQYKLPERNRWTPTTKSLNTFLVNHSDRCHSGHNDWTARNEEIRELDTIGPQRPLQQNNPCGGYKNHVFDFSFFGPNAFAADNLSLRTILYCRVLGSADPNCAQHHKPCTQTSDCVGTA